MKAAILKENGVLSYEETELKEIDNRYRIKVAYAGICGSDLGSGLLQTARTHLPHRQSFRNSGNGVRHIFLHSAQRDFNERLLELSARS